MGIGHHIFCKNITITFKIYGKVMKHISYWNYTSGENQMLEYFRCCKTEEIGSFANSKIE